MSLTRKTLEISGPTYSLPEAAAEAAVAEAAEAAPEVAAAEVAAAAAAVDAGAYQPEAVASAKLEHLPITLTDAGCHGRV
jgi:flavin-binding protein dodecin